MTTPVKVALKVNNLVSAAIPIAAAAIITEKSDTVTKVVMPIAMAASAFEKMSVSASVTTPTAVAGSDWKNVVPLGSRNNNNTLTAYSTVK